MNEKKAKKNDNDDADVELQPDLDELDIESDDTEPNDRRRDPLRKP